MSGWKAVGLLNGEAHVFPIEDLKPHEKSPGCWCSPEQDEDEYGVWVHNALDEREKYETGQRRLS